MKKLMLTNESTAELCLEMQYQLHAGIGNADALSNICEDLPDSSYKKALQNMAEQADDGYSLSAVLANSGCFQEYVVNMLEAGERTGRIEEAFGAVAAACGNMASIDKRIKSALLYPALLMLIMLMVIAVLLIYVMPVFEDVYAQLGGGMNGIAGALLNLGKVLGNISPLLIVVFSVAVIILILFSFSDSFRERILELWWKRKGTKGVSGKIGKARFSQVLSMCMNSGLPVEEAIETAAKLMNDFPDAIAGCRSCIELLNSGNGLAYALGESGVLPKAQCRILEAGVRSGSGEKAMEKIAEYMTEDADIALEESIGKIEPAIVIISSVLVGMILISVMLPLINIMNAIG